MIDQRPLQLVVKGSFACFTNPLSKIERISYPILTPTAAKGILENIYWYPGCIYQPYEIWLLQPIQYITLTTNEIKLHQKPDRVINVNDSEKVRVIRHNQVLYQVAYLIKADLQGGNVDQAKAIFRRRLRTGQSYHPLYLGISDFPAEISQVRGTEQPIVYDEQLGPMMLRLTYPSGSTMPTITTFEAEIKAGIMRMPQGD